MIKYAMVTINHKYDDKDNLLVRRVLISYESKEKAPEKEDVVNYTGTRFVAKDDYFSDKSKSHQYNFHDANYELTKVTNEWREAETKIGLVQAKRPYHYYVDVNLSSVWPKYADPIEFEAETDEEAIKKFHEREELR